MLCEAPRKQLSEIAMPFEPYALEKGFDTVLCSEHNVTIEDVITSCPKLEECPCIKFDKITVVMVVQTGENTFKIVSFPLQNIDNYGTREMIAFVKNAIAHNIGVIFPGIAKDRYGTKVLPTFVPGSRDVKECKMVLNAWAELLNTNQMDVVNREMM